MLAGDIWVQRHEILESNMLSQKSVGDGEVNVISLKQLLQGESLEGICGVVVDVGPIYYGNVEGIDVAKRDVMLDEIICVRKLDGIQVAERETIVVDEM